MAREILKIKTYVDGVNDIPFPSEEEQIGITEYTYTSKRMGGVTLSATLMYRECLDKKWTGLQYVEFRGEKYFISATPSSGKDNEDARYEHTLSFIPERDLKLNNVYFYDAVSDESTGDDKYKSNSTKVVFFGTIQEFVARLNESLKYSGLDYTVVIDDGITSEGKLMSFEDQFFFNVLQEIYNTYELPFYFVGKVIHIGFTSNAITQTFKYGFENELLSIKKNNANYRIINRCTGIGSEDNIPYYYPNNSPKGDIAAQAGSSNSGVLQNDIRIIDPVLFAEKFDLVNSLEYESSSGSLDVSLRHGIYKGSGGASYSDYTQGSKFELTFPLSFPQYTQNLWTIVSGSVSAPVKRKFRLSFGYKWLGGDYSTSISFRQRVSNATENCSFQDGTDEFFHLEITEAGDFQFIIQTMITITAGAYTDQNAGYAAKYELSYTVDWQSIMQWTYNGKNVDNIEDMGISIGDAVPEDGDTIKQVLQQYIIPSKNLMPSVYRETLGAERFYNALNDTYTNPETGEKYVFENEYDPMIPREHKQEFEEIKPTIKGMKNAAGQRMDQILDIAFDEDDNDEVDEEGNYLHPHFFVKLPKYDGDYGFNLFDHAIEEEEMSFSMTSGQCGACEFKVKVDKDTMKNPVQVNSSGNLMRDESGNVITSGEFQDRQNDTSEYEVWIALEKEESTYGQIMPNVRQNLKPKAGDSFVILHIDLPQAYILNAENELKEAIIKYMAQNNSEKFNFSINFSRIYLEENPEIENQLNENARIQVEYDGIKYDFYISQYTYKCLDEEALPEITVEITDTITVNKTTLQNTADSIKQDMNDALGNIDFLTMGLRYFIRKDIDDEVIGKIRFRKGIEFGNYSPGLLGSGGAVYTDENNSSHIEIDFLTVRRKAEFTSISVQELKHIGGQLILSPAAMVCSSVEDIGEAYRCYFKTGREDDGDVGSTIFNEFVVGDQARIQNFNQLEIRYYWRLVVGVGDNYIDLSKTDCDSGSVEPRAGDNIVQLGNRDDVTRQAAQILSCYGSNAPSYIMYNGINSYSLEGKNITGIIYNPESGEPQLYSFGQMFFGDRNIEDPSSTFITFQKKEGDTKKRIYVKGGLTLTEGSSGLSNLEEWPAIQDKIDKAIAGTDVEYYSSTSPTELVDGEWSTTAPQWTPGRYIWSRTKVSYADGTSSYTDPVCISGNDGDGQGITKITEYYYLSTSPTELIGGEWSTTAPTWVDGSYIWTKSRMTFADGSTKDTDPICVTGPTGKPGEDGHDGSDGTSVLAQYSADGSLWHDSYQEGDIWMRTSSDNGGSWSPAIRIVGKDGAQGRGVQAVTEYYLVSSRSSGVSEDDPGWSKTIPTMTKTEKFLWNKETVEYTDGTSETTSPVVIGVYGDEGSAGKGIEKITEYYLASASDSGVTTSTSGWTTSVQKTDATKRYLWNYERIDYTDESYTETEPAIIGTQGEQGIPGVPGEPGDDGKTTYTWIRYADDAQGGGISDDPTGKNYIGFAYNKETPVESDTPSDYKWSDIKGEQGVPGEPGADGTTLYTWIAYSDNADGSGMYQQPKDTTEYIGIAVNKDTPEESTDPNDYTWSRFKGDPGADGSYVIVMFAKNTSTTTPPESGWESEPPEVVQSGEYVWMRTGVVIPPAVTPEGWNKPVRLTGDSGSDGQSVYLLDLSNEVATVSCDSEGNVTSDMPECTATVYRGGDEDFRFGFTAVFTGCSGSINRASGVINISAITEDTAQVSVTASLSGAPTLNAVMTITKVYPGPPGDPGQDGQDGTDGQDAVLYYLLPSTDKIVKGFTGKIDPASVTCAKYRQVGNQTAVIDDTSSVVIKYQRLGEDTYEQTYTGAVEVTADTTAVVFTLYDNGTLIDRERVPVLTDASDLEMGSGNLLKYTSFAEMDGLVSRDCSHTFVPDTSAYENDGQKSARIETFSAMTTAAGTHTISSVTVYYARKTETGNIASLSWSTSRTSLTATYCYLYAQLRITYSDGTSGRTVPVLVGQYYSNNAISSVSPYYLATSDETASPYEGGWSTSRPTLTSSSIYMYVHFRTTYGDGTVSKSVAVNAGCYNKTGLELLMWPENLKKDRNLMFSFSVRGVSGSRMYITIDGAETEAMTEAGGWITVNLSSLWSRYTVDFGKITSYSSSEKSRLRIIFSATGQYHFNTPMLSYGTIQGDWTPAHEDVEYKMTDLEYLRTLFPNSTLVAGATISQMAVVTDGDPEDGGQVVAGLNGTEIGKDTSVENHGKVLIFAGSEGADDDAIQNAKTKIYEDGTIDTEKLMAREGQIADMLFTPVGILTSETETTSQGYDETHYLSLRAAGLNIGNIDDRRTTSTSTALNRTMKIMAVPGGGMDISDGEGMFPASVATIAAFGVSSIERGKGAKLTDNIAILIEAKGHASPEYNLAIKCLEGMFAGLRPKFRYATSTSFYPDEFDHTIISSHDDGSYRIYLPSSPKAGQQYHIIKQGSHYLDIHGNGHNIHRPMSWEVSILNLFKDSGDEFVLIYDPEAEKWWCQYFLPSTY